MLLCNEQLLFQVALNLFNDDTEVFNLTKVASLLLALFKKLEKSAVHRDWWMQDELKILHEDHLTQASFWCVRSKVV